MPLIEIGKLLEDAYQVKIKIDSDHLQRYRLTAEFQNKPLEYVLEVITATTNSAYVITGKNIKIYEKAFK
jgi:hypothetical protein